MNSDGKFVFKISMPENNIRITTTQNLQLLVILKILTIIRKIPKELHNKLKIFAIVYE